MLFSASKIEPMKLHQKTLLIIGVTFIILIGIIHSKSATILHQVSQFEGRETHQQIKQVQSALSNQPVQLNKTNRNWAEWDKTYNIINNTNKAYIIKDIYGQPALIVCVAMLRIYQQGGASISYLILSVLVVGLVFSIVTLLLLEQLISSRLSHLVNHLRSIKNSKEFLALQSIIGKDE